MRIVLYLDDVCGQLKALGKNITEIHVDTGSKQFTIRPTLSNDDRLLIKANNKHVLIYPGDMVKEEDIG